MRNRLFRKSKIIKKQLRALSRSLISEYQGYSLISEPITAREKHYSLVGYMLTANSHRDEVEVTIVIFTEPEVTNCFSKIALVIIQENKTKTKVCASETSTNPAAILKTESRHCYNFDNHPSNFTK